MSDLTLTLRVARRTDEAEGIAGFELVSADGAPLPPFEAGAHLDVQVPGGPVRSYSLCNDPAERHRYLIAVLREPASRGGSAGMHARVHEGTVLTCSAPRNRFPLREGARAHLLLAGGIGITPLLAMAERLAATGADFTLHHATRSAARTPFRARLAASRFAPRVHHHLDDGDAAQRLDLAAVLTAPRPGTQLYVCGPAGFMDAVLATARAAGWPPETLNWEAFGAAPSAAPAGGDRPFEIELGRSGRVIPVAADQTALEALRAEGVYVPSSCEEGVCGTCLTVVLGGECDHRDQYLTDEERAANDQFLPCRSRAKGERLVLDL